MTDPVIGGITSDRGDDHQEVQEENIQRAAGTGCESPGGKQQGIPGQEGGHHQAGFDEDDHEQDGVCPSMEDED